MLDAQVKEREGLATAISTVVEKPKANSNLEAIAKRIKTRVDKAEKQTVAAVERALKEIEKASDHLIAAGLETVAFRDQWIADNPKEKKGDWVAACCELTGLAKSRVYELARIGDGKETPEQQRAAKAQAKARFDAARREAEGGTSEKKQPPKLTKKQQEMKDIMAEISRDMRDAYDSGDIDLLKAYLAAIHEANNATASDEE